MDADLPTERRWPLTTPSSAPSSTDARRADDHVDYLVVDEFLRDLTGARALKSALELGVVDALAVGPCTLQELTNTTQGDALGARLLVDLLVAAGAVEEADGAISLTKRFAHALQYRDLLDTKLDFIGFVLLDFVDHFNALVTDPAKFMRQAQLFRLFDYQRSVESTPENYAWTRVWMKLTTALTKYEAGAALHHYDFGVHRRILDVGGNSGEFVLRLCRAHPELRATVLDLPVVCEFGQDHILPEPECERISFVPGNALTDPIPDGFDLISFKSMLHDWPDIDAIRFLERAAESLEPGGTLLIFERAPLDFASGSPPLSLLPILLFARSYRGPSLYEEKLEAMGFADIEVQDVELETPFFLLTARKPAC